MTNNRTRILSQVLSLEAWHEPFRLDGDTAAVYVELSFREGRVGGDDRDIPFTFVINLKRALLTVQLEAPLQIDRHSIARGIPETQVEHSKVRTAKLLAESSLIGKAKLSPASLHLALSGHAKADSAVSQEDQLRVVQTIPETLVTPRPENARAYSWEMEPSFHPTLRGQPWHPVDAPRLKMRVRGALGKLLPAVRAEVTCALEDIEITDLKAKNPGVNQGLRNIVYNEVSHAAAVQHLKLILKDADLEPGLLDNRFSNLIIASVLAAPK